MLQPLCPHRLHWNTVARLCGIFFRVVCGQKYQHTCGTEGGGEEEEEGGKSEGGKSEE